MTSTCQSIVNVVDFGMDMKTAVTVPRFHSEEGQIIFVEPGASRVDCRSAACPRQRDRAHDLHVARPGDPFPPRGRRAEAGPDPRGGGGVGKYP